MHGKNGAIIVVPPSLLEVFKQVVEKGMAFEFGQPAQLYDFSDRFRLVKPEGN